MSAWEKLYSKRISTLRPSPIREMLHVIRQPGMISFAGATPIPNPSPLTCFMSAPASLRNRAKMCFNTVQPRDMLH